MPESPELFGPLSVPKMAILKMHATSHQRRVGIVLDSLQTIGWEMSWTFCADHRLGNVLTLSADYLVGNAGRQIG